METKTNFNEIFKLLRNKQIYFFDLDGTLYLEDLLFDGILNLINKLKSFQKKIFFLSNDSSISTKEYLLKLEQLGLDTVVENIHTPNDTIFKREKN